MTHSCTAPVQMRYGKTPLKAPNETGQIIGSPQFFTAQ